jgi:DHA1 family bicyclomycin/chloramphenicol resistance-like MFS transporter
MTAPSIPVKGDLQVAQPVMSHRFVMMCATMFAVLPLATDIVLVALPDIATEYGRGLAGGHQVMSAFVLGLAVAHLFIGGLSDRYGRKPVAIAGFALFTLASLGAAISTSFEMLVTMRALQGLAGATGPVLMRSIVRDLSAKGGGQRPMATIAAISGIAPLLAPVIGATLAGTLGWRGTFAFLSIYGGATTLALVLLLSESLPVRARAQRLRFLSFSVVKTLLRDRPFLLGSLVLAVGYGGLFTWLTAAGFIVTNELGGTRTDLAVLYTLGSVGYILGGGVAIRLPERWNRIRTGAGVALAGSVLCAGVAFGSETSFWWLVPIALYYGGWAIMQPLAIATAMRNHAEHAGQASAVAGALQLAGGLVLSSIAIALGGGLIVLGLIAMTLTLLLVLLSRCRDGEGFKLV